MLSLLVIQNDADKSAGRIGDALSAEGLALDVRFPTGGLPALDGYDGVVALPGVADPDDDDPAVHRVRETLAAAIGRGLPVLGVCLGGQLVAQALGARTYRCEPELGYHDVSATADVAADPLLTAAPRRFPTFHAHVYGFEAPEGAVVLLETDACVQAMRHGDRTWAFQFHPETTVEWADDLARGIRGGDTSSVLAVTTEFFRSNGVDPDQLERDTRAAADRAHALAVGIGRGFATVVRQTANGW